MKKSFAILMTAILVLSMFSFVAPVRASTGHPELGYMNGASWYVCNNTVDVKAGTMNVFAMDGVPVTGNFTIYFNGTNPEPVDFSGAVFDLYMSKDGYSSLSADDLEYAGGFNVNDLENDGLMEFNVTNSLLKGGMGTFYIGTVDGVQMLVGPIAYDITNDYHYIKVFDGTGTLVAVAAYVNILASLALTPTSGPGGAYVCLTGVALAPNQVYNISYDDDATTTAQVTTGSDGKFSYCWNIKDLCKVYDGGESETVTIYLYEYGGGFIDSVDFTEMYRVFLTIDDSTGPYGNLTGYWGVNIFDDFEVEGNFFNPTGPVVITVDGIELASVTPNATGYFDVTFEIPILAMENHTVKVSNVGCNLFFDIWVYPTLVVTPDVGPIGTEVEFTAYGFPANIPVYLYWEVDGQCDYETCYIWVANTTVGGDGTFNVTTTWVVTKMYGGPHWVYALPYYQGEGTCGWNASIADTFFTVTPSLWVTPSTISNDGTTFWVNGSGFDPSFAYTINIDNNAYTVPITGYFSNDYYMYWYGDYFYPYPFSTWVYNPAGGFVVSDSCGDIAIELVAAGFYPGTHAVALTASGYNDYWMYWDVESFWDLYPEEHIFDGFFAVGNEPGVNWNQGFYPTDVYATFTVSTEGDLVVGDITANTTAAFNALNAKITAIEDDIATVQTDVGTLKVSVSSLDAKVVALQGSVATVQTTLGTMTGTLTSVAGDMATVKTQVGTINANVASVKSFLPVDMMPVWIAVIFAIIAAIASIYGVLVIRSKIAQ